MVAYGTVSYLRFTGTDGNVHCSFLMSKLCLAPHKVLSIPRLGSTAATLVVKLHCVFLRELEVPVNRSVIWTDSTSVLQYIHNAEKACSDS